MLAVSGETYQASAQSWGVGVRLVSYLYLSDYSVQSFLLSYALVCGKCRHYICTVGIVCLHM